MNEDLLIRMMLEAARFGNAARCNSIVQGARSAPCFQSRAAFLRAAGDVISRYQIRTSEVHVAYAATIVRGYEPTPFERFAAWVHSPWAVRLLVVLALVLMAASYVSANPFTFDPWPQESRLHPYREVRVTLVDAALPGAACLAMSDSIVDYALAPLTIQAVGCAIFTERGQRPACVIAMPFTGPAQALALTTLSTPNQVFSHEFMHCVEGHNHVPFISFIRVRP